MKWPSYEEWVDKAISIETREQADMCMDVYVLPNGDHVRHDAVMPRHWGHRSYTRAILFGVQVPKGTELPNGGELWDTYTDETMGTPVWNEDDDRIICPDSLKAAYEYERQRHENRTIPGPHVPGPTSGSEQTGGV